MLGAFAADIEWYEAEGMPYGGLHRGGEAVAQNVFGPMSQDVDGFSFTPEEFMGSGDTVAAVVRYTGTGKATGKALNVPVVHVWDIRDTRGAAETWRGRKERLGPEMPAGVSQCLPQAASGESPP